MFPSALRPRAAARGDISRPFLQAIRSLLVADGAMALDSIYFQALLQTSHGLMPQLAAVLPKTEEPPDDDDEKRGKPSDAPKAEGPDPREDPNGLVFHIELSCRDLVGAFHKMQLLPRLRYILEVSVPATAGFLQQANAGVRGGAVMLQVGQIKESVLESLEIATLMAAHSRQR
jgi:hypothetical protein